MVKQMENKDKMKAIVYEEYGPFFSLSSFLQMC
jgi:hypothetical protein